MTYNSFISPSPVCGLRGESPPLSSGYKTNIHTPLDGPADFYPDMHNSGPYPSSTSWKPLSPVPSLSRSGHPDFKSNTTVYPSPPPTSSRPGQSVPLPDVCATPGLIATKQSLESYDHSFGLDSPPTIGHEVLKLRDPFSPPPTLPTQTLTLPPMEYDPTTYQEMQGGLNFNSQSTSMMPADVHHPGIRYLSPPPSPEGKAAGDSFSSSAHDNLFFADSPQPLPLFVDHEVPEMVDPFDYHSYDTLRTRPAQRKWYPAVDVPMNDDSSKLSDTISTSSGPWYLPGEDVDSDMTLWDHMTQATSSPPLYILRPQDFHHNRLLSPPYPHPSSPLLSSPASSDQDLDSHDFDDRLMTPFSPPSSPLLRSFSDLPMVEDEDDYLSHISHDNRPTFGSTSQIPSQSENCSGKATSIRSFPGVEVDADLIPIDLASRSSAPEHCIVIPASPYITPSTLLSLPPTSHSAGHHGNFYSDSSAKYGGSSSLLLYDDFQNDVVVGSSGLDTVLDQLNPAIVAKDLELKWLLDLRTRVLASERKARMVEAQYENLKAFWLRDVRNRAEVVEDEPEAQFQLQQDEARMQMSLAIQAKKARKRERGRLKEIDALIEIKLKEKGLLPGHNNEGMELSSPCGADGDMQDRDAGGIGSASHKCVHDARSNKDITSMPQLVARMILLRRESRLRPLTRPRHVRGGQGSASCYSQQGRATGRHRSSPLALTAPSIHDQHGVISEEWPESQSNALQFDRERCRLHSPLHWRMDIDRHACSDSGLNTLDDLDLDSPFNLLSLSDT